MRTKHVSSAKIAVENLENNGDTDFWSFFIPNLLTLIFVKCEVFIFVEK